VDRKGHALTLVMNDELAADGSWKLSPLQWATVSAAEMKMMLDKLEEQTAGSIVRVQLNFRSPKANKAQASRRYRSEDDEATELNVTGIAVEPNLLFVLANLKPKVTARLESILVYTGEEPIKAQFAGTLKDYGCFAAVPEKPLLAVSRDTSEVSSYRNKLLLAADISIEGEKRVVYTGHRRIASFADGWQNHIYPEMAGDAKNTFLFDIRGKIIAMPLSRREKAGASDDEHWSSKNSLTTPVCYLGAVTEQLAKNSDSGNIPLSEEQENRLAWLGVELQGLTEELAKVNNVSHLTKDGTTGAIVSYVYLDSPAAKAGIEAGYVILRLHVAGNPKPIEVELKDRGMFDERGFPWDRLGEIPEQYFDQIPQPWPAAENSFTRAISDLGFGTSFTAEFFHDGKTITKDFTVTESPAYYDSAPRYKSETLGLTVRNITYEVQRYFQRSTMEPGVIISKIEPGSKASVAGIKPYEIVTHVNDEGVFTAADFEKLTKGKDELKLNVKRMTQGRVVAMNVTAPSPAAPASATVQKEPAGKPEEPTSADVPQDGNSPAKAEPAAAE
jgi:hypothetical protein